MRNLSASDFQNCCCAAPSSATCVECVSLSLAFLWFDYVDYLSLVNEPLVLTVALRLVSAESSGYNTPSSELRRLHRTIDEFY